MSEFIFLKKDIKVNNKLTIKKYEVGIVASKKRNMCDVLFSSVDTPISISNKFLELFDPSKTGDAYSRKVCNVCNRLLPTDCFARNQNGKNNRIVRRPSCNNCRKIIDGADTSTNEKRKWEATKPNLQFWKCPICGKITIPGLTSKVVLDHDHKTGLGRAWICDSCNTGLGRFKDNVQTLENAIQYLKSH